MTVEIAEKRLSFEEYLEYEDGTGSRYELVLGNLELINPPTVRHFLIAKLLEQEFDSQIADKNLDWLCFREAGIRRVGKNRDYQTCLLLIKMQQWHY